VFRTSALATMFGLSLASAAPAAVVVFSDDFNYGPRTVLNAPDSVFGGTWTTTNGTVDYLAPPTADFSNLCNGTAGCVDLDGSTGNAGLFSTVASFAAGTYELTIQLFGNGRGGSDTVTITLGSWSVTLSGIASNADVSQTFAFTTSGGVLSFENAGGDNVGAVLSSVSLAAVPLPAGGLLLIGAFGGLVALRRRKTV
jgi:hypothetical protein